jgi:uncharacterized protein YdeI (YjbR/CyaY-like superfamily)
MATTKRSPNYPEVYPKTRATWRRWLASNHTTSPGIWLVLDKKKLGSQALTTSEAIEEALCFGWIDSRPNKLDEHRYLLLLTPRKPKSAWSKINRDRVSKLIAAGRMTPAGQAKVDDAKLTGQWLQLLPFESLETPKDLVRALHSNLAALKQYETFSQSARTQILRWIADAKRPETRAKRITETVRLAALGEKPNQYRPRKK